MAFTSSNFERGSKQLNCNSMEMHQIRYKTTQKAKEHHWSSGKHFFIRVQRLLFALFGSVSPLIQTLVNMQIRQIA